MKYIVLALLIGVQWVNAQIMPPDTIAQKQLSKLSFLEGDWEGKGWMMTPDGKKNNFVQKEQISFKLDHTILHIQGQGYVGEEKIHDALAVVSWDNNKGEFNFQSYLHTGRKGSAKAELKEGKLYWYPAPSIQYIIWIDEAGRWQEIGKYKMGEDNWYQFFSMSLAKVN